MRDYYVSIKPADNIKASSFKKNEKVKNLVFVTGYGQTILNEFRLSSFILYIEHKPYSSRTPTRC